MHNFMAEQERLEVLAGFGEARLVRTLDGKYEMRGGSEGGRKAAAEWIWLFCPDLIGICGREG